MTCMRTLVLADLHLTRATPAGVARDVVRLFEQSAGSRVILNGDLFDLSAEAPKQPSVRALGAVFEAQPEIRAALGNHLDRGGQLWMVSGNHDADLSDGPFRDALVESLRLSPDARARLRFSPWFFREGNVHIEHGHFHDPDNAPAHPLIHGEPSLGVHFVEQFIAPTGAFAYLNANDSTPLKLFLSSFSWYGRRAPYVIYRYFYAAISAMLRSGPLYRAHDERLRGESLADLFADEAAVPREVLRDLLAEGPAPTLESLSRTFSRLYFDRVLATAALLGGVGQLAMGRKTTGAVTMALGGLLMSGSWARGHNRYGGTVSEYLSDGAERVISATGAKLVVFGHTHREAHTDSYANTASFSFPVDRERGRPYLELSDLDGTPRATRHYIR